jgi:hypothetical protein
MSAVGLTRFDGRVLTRRDGSAVCHVFSFSLGVRYPIDSLRPPTSVVIPRSAPFSTVEQPCDHRRGAVRVPRSRSRRLEVLPRVAEQQRVPDGESGDDRCSRRGVTTGGIRRTTGGVRQRPMESDRLQHRDRHCPCRCRHGVRRDHGVDRSTSGTATFRSTTDNDLRRVDKSRVRRDRQPDRARREHEVSIRSRTTAVGAGRRTRSRRDAAQIDARRSKGPGTDSKYRPAPTQALRRADSGN